jgi:hypothetical protein
VRFAVLSLLALPPLWVLWLARSSPLPRPPAVIAATTPPTIDANGRVYLDEGKLSHVRSPGVGRIVRIDARPGDRVRAGASLAVVERSTEDPAWASYCSAETALKEDRGTAYARCMPSLGPRPRDAVIAPADGTVLRSTAVLNAATGGADTEGKPDLFVLGDPARWMAEADVGALDAARVLAGAPVRAHIAALPGVTLVGQVVRVSSVDPSTRVARVTCAMETPAVESEAYASVEIALGPPA